MKHYVLPCIIGISLLVLVTGAIGESDNPPSPQVTDVRPLSAEEVRADTTKAVVTLEAANALLNEGRHAQNPYMVGLASIIYFQANREYALSLLSEATKIAKSSGDARALRWLADIWASPVLGAGDAERQRDCLTAAEKAAAGVKMGFAGTSGGTNSMFPSGFFGQE